MPIDWPRFVELIHTHESFVLTSHLKPDCDALGSELGMAMGLESLGKQARIVNAMAAPAALDFIDAAGRIETLHESVEPQELDEADAMIVLDTSAWVQLGGMGDVLRETNAQKIVLDHHVSSDDLGAEVFRDDKAEATGRLVVDALDALGVEITREMAMPLFAAIATDTGWFRFSSTTANTYRVTARLVEAGAVPGDIYQQLYEQDTTARLNLRGRALARAATDLGGRLMYTGVRRNDFAETGAVAADTEDIINLTLAVAGVEVAVMFSEQLDRGGVKVSFRSRTDFDCSAVSQRLGGGGHKQAAGAYLEGTYDAVEAQVLDVVRATMG